MLAGVTGLEAFLLGLGLGDLPFQFGVGIRPQCLQLIEPWRLVPHLGQWLNDIGVAVGSYIPLAAGVKYSSPWPMSGIFD